MIAYEWLVETLKGEQDDIVDVSHWDTLADARKHEAYLLVAGRRLRLGLVRDRFRDVDEYLEERQWAYFDGEVLPDHFEDCAGHPGAKVPRRYLAEARKRY